MYIDWNKLLSAVVALCYLLFAYFKGESMVLFKTALSLLLPMSAIWFSDAMGSALTRFPGPLSMHPITQHTPGIMVAIGGWILLLSPIFAFGIIKLID